MPKITATEITFRCPKIEFPWRIVLAQGTIEYEPPAQFTVSVFERDLKASEVIVPLKGLRRLCPSLDISRSSAVKYPLASFQVST